MKKEFKNTAIEVVRLKKVDIVTDSGNCDAHCINDCPSVTVCTGTDY